MTAMWFGLAAIALVGAIVLLYFDRVQRQRTGHARQVWAKAQGYTYVSVEPALASTWRRGALAKLGYLSAVDVVSGIRKGEKFVLFDLEDAATLVAVRRQIGSEIDVDMRLKTASPPKDHDLELLGAIGDRVVFATDPEIARHAVDQRMVGFIETLPDSVQMLWSEGNWTLGQLPCGSAPKDWETTIDAVLRLSGLLHVLPPVADPLGDEVRPQADRRTGEDPADDFDDAPRGVSAYADAEFDDEPRFRPELADESRFRGPDAEGESEYGHPEFDDDEPHFRDVGSGERDVRGGDYTDYDDDPDDLDDPDVAGDPPSRPGRRPSLAVVPEPRARGAEPADQAESGRAGGPFHPGFRPYQGPAPR